MAQNIFEEPILSIINNDNLRNALITIKEGINNNGAVDSLKNTKGYSADLWIGLLKNEDAKVRKNTAIIMGALQEEGFSDVLFKAYEEENTLFVKAAYLEALVNYDYKQYGEALTTRMKELSEGTHEENEVKHIAAELKILRKMFPGEKKHKRHVFIGTKSPIRVVLTTKKDLIPTVHNKVEATGGFSDVKSIFCGVAATITDFAVVKKLRVYKELLIPINGMKVMTKAELLSKLVGGNLMDLLDTLHRPSDAPFYFRITAKDLDVATIGAKLEAMSGGRLVNSASDYEIEVKLIKGKDDKIIAFLKLYTMADNRFSYRAHHVAASIHPSNAAVIVEMAREYLKKGATILDPFCGVGTMLIERNKLVNAKYMYGTDTFGKAIEGARGNSLMAGAEVNYINRDYFDFTHEQFFDEIISNFPELKDRQEADDFYGRFFDKTESILKSGGVIIMYSGEKNLIKKHLRLNKKYKLLREFVFNEKEDKNVFVIEFRQ